jgi:hypothetical protein
VTVHLVARYRGKSQDSELASSAVAPAKGGKVNTSVNFAIMTAQSASYAVIVAAPSLQSTQSRPSFLDYNVTVRSAPVILNVNKPEKSLSVPARSTLFAVKLYRNKPLYLRINNALVQQVWGARALIRNGAGQQVVVESPGRNGYAALWITDSSDQMQSPMVTGRLAEQEPALYLGVHTSISGVDASVSSVHIAKAEAPFAVDTSCPNIGGGSLDLIGSGARPAEITAPSVPRSSALVPVADESNYRLILLTNDTGINLSCAATVRSFARQKITATTSRRIKIYANSTFNAYPIQLPANSVIIVNHLNGAPASLDCFSGQITESDSDRLVAFAPKNHDCVLSIARSSSEVADQVSFPLLITSVPGR